MTDQLIPLKDTFSFQCAQSSAKPVFDAALIWAFDRLMKMLVRKVPLLG